ncbi:hypothetical protein ACO2Q0_13240 [Phenylobacterium sp. VNQ135]|uniref:hypothetical protein n=1 Tax=Phenylobacterium sp. VNQ135 TaxID=3400922 RepID=UPI003C0AE8A9
MSLLTAPLWVQIALVAEALALAWLAWRFGWRGVLWGVAASVGFWFLLGLVASYLVGRLEGGRAALLPDILSGAVLGAVRLALVAAPLVLAGAALGGVARRFIKPKRGVI